MADAAAGIQRTSKASLPSLLSYALVAILVLHAILILVLQSDLIVASRYATAAAPLMAGLCGLWRAQKVPLRERLPWRLLSASMVLWAVGQSVEAAIGRSSSALNFAPDAADFFNIIAAFPMLLTLSNTRRTESIRSVFYLDSAQSALAVGLAYVLLFRMPLPATQGATTMAGIYIAECLLLAVAAVVRLATWSTLEERRRIHLLFIGVWMFLPINLGMNYATHHWNLHAGTMFDLLWSVPFIYAGWQALHLPTTENPTATPKVHSRGRLLIESLCPFLIMAGIFALAASITTQHPYLGLSAILILLLIQSLHAGVVQLNYVTVQRLLMERERELKDANVTLEKLSMLDPLTGIPNRRQFDSAFDGAWRRAMRRKVPVALLIIDVDFFKGINDRQGHSYGDECLVKVARVLEQQAERPDDLLARYGGDEFALLLPETDMHGAITVANRIHEAIHDLAIANEASPFDKHLTLSIGVGVGDAEPGVNLIVLMDVADQALYEAKRLGRNETQTAIIPRETYTAHAKE